MRLHPKYGRYFWSGAVVGIISVLVPFSSLVFIGFDALPEWRSLGVWLIMGGGILMIGPCMMFDALQKSKELYALQKPHALPDLAKKPTPPRR